MSVGTDNIDLLYELLPAIHRIRDAEQGEPLKPLLRVIADGHGVSTREYLEGLIHYAVSQWRRPGSWEAVVPFDFCNYTEGGHADRWF